MREIKPEVGDLVSFIEDYDWMARFVPQGYISPPYMPLIPKVKFSAIGIIVHKYDEEVLILKTNGDYYRTNRIEKVISKGNL